MTEPIKPPRKRPFRAPPETWAMVKAAYVGGKSAPQCAEEFGVEVAALRARALREGWTKKAAWSRAQAELAAAAEPLDAGDPIVIADAALNRALEALHRGHAAEAQALIKAGNAVGEFAEFVKALKRERAAELLPD